MTKVKLLLGFFLLMPGSFILMAMLITKVSELTGINSFIFIALATVLGIGLVLSNKRVKA